MVSGERLVLHLPPRTGGVASYIAGLISGAALGGIGVTAAYVWFGLIRYVQG